MSWERMIKPDSILIYLAHVICASCDGLSETGLVLEYIVSHTLNLNSGKIPNWGVTGLSQIFVNTREDVNFISIADHLLIV
jgi:hypothetical protein